MTLTEFLLARIDEDEAVARACETGPPIVQALQVGMDHHEGVENGWVEIDPARVLADCASKRRIVEYHITDDPCAFSPEPLLDDFWCRTLQLLATAYADHPEFKEEWRA